MSDVSGAMQGYFGGIYASNFNQFGQQFQNYFHYYLRILGMAVQLADPYKKEKFKQIYRAKSRAPKQYYTTSCQYPTDVL